MGRPKKDSTPSGSGVSLKDDLAVLLAENLNKEFKDYKVAYFFDEGPPTNVVDWVSSGNALLDLIISNRKNGGFPVGKISELTGLEASGKSLLAAHALATTQQKGGVAVYIDTESAVSDQFLAAIGVDMSKLLYVQLETIEDIFATIENIVANVRKSSKDRLVTIVVDSVAGATTKVELEADYDKDGWATTKAIVISKAMRKLTNIIARQKVALIFTNQLREKLGVSFGDKFTTSGGRALGFHSSARLRLKAIGAIKVKHNGIDEVIGIKCKVQVIKNRMGPPLRTVEYDMYFESGIDNYGGWLKFLSERKLIAEDGRGYIITDHNGKKIKFQKSDWQEMLGEKEFYDHVYDMLAESLIMKYKASSVNVEDIEISEDDIHE